MWSFKQMGVINHFCLLFKLFANSGNFLSPRRESTQQHMADLRWDTLTIELPELRWQSEGYSRVTLCMSPNKKQLCHRNCSKNWNKRSVLRRQCWNTNRNIKRFMRLPMYGQRSVTFRAIRTCVREKRSLFFVYALAFAKNVGPRIPYIGRTPSFLYFDLLFYLVPNSDISYALCDMVYM